MTKTRTIAVVFVSSADVEGTLDHVVLRPVADRAGIVLNRGVEHELRRAGHLR